MDEFSTDPIENVVIEGIIKGIRIALKNDCLRAAVILIYSGVDTMAYLNMPETQTEVTKRDFVTWCDKYMKFPCEEQLTGLDLYGARCSMLHTYSIDSKLSRENKCRLVGYMDHSEPAVLYDIKKAPNLVLVSVRGLERTFIEAIKSFLIDTAANADKQRCFEKRLVNMAHQLPF